ncbi:hypothetical protein D3C78_1713240 [compost metagenome]
MLRIRIKDNGKGMTEDELTALLAFTASNTTHIGLANVRARLHLLFGELSSFTMWSEPNLYTTVEIGIPLITKGVQYD